MAISSRLGRHLDQIDAAVQDISLMCFSEPGTFTKSQIERPPITSLIRDTSSYERVLFSSTTQESFPKKSVTTTNKSALLGSLLDTNVMHQMRTAVRSTQLKGEVDVSTLLQGADNLARIYPTPGLDEKIQMLRSRYQDLQNSVALYEEFIAAQRTQLDLQRGGTEQEEVYQAVQKNKSTQESSISRDILTEEMTIQELENKRLGLEADVRELDRELGVITNFSM